MKNIDSNRYTALDHPSILSVLFHPRAQIGEQPSEGNEHLIAAGDDINIGARFYINNPESPNILFFHGNGEIVADYDGLGPAYNSLGINFLAVDYRGYGRSGGYPTAGKMMTDCHVIFEYTIKWLKQNEHNGPLIIMGRSLGSASALELSSSRQDSINGLIIESGFAYTLPLLKLLGASMQDHKLTEANGFCNLEKMTHHQKPALIIHAEHDHIIPFSDAQALFHACPAKNKTFKMIKDANHNDILARSFLEYMKTIKNFLSDIN
ncbi:MAG: alpha/beta hydrolase [Desulfobacteraceae bacterium]|nr:alpha/beta hydrolase [Desulfobacteraceae bacterium]